MEAIVRARFQRFGSRKVNQVLDEIRGKSVQKAQERLPMIPRRATTLVTKALKSAFANLENRAGKKLEPKTVFVKAAWVGNGPMGNMKRVLPAPMGRAMTIKRKVCHLTLIVSEKGS